MGKSVAETNEKLDKFVECLADGAGLHVSAAAAGYDLQDAWALYQTPRVSRLVEYRVRSVLRNEHAPRAMAFLGKLAADEAAPLKERRQAAQFVLERAGYVAPRAQVQEAAEKSISAMSAEELASLVEKLEQERASRAKDVSAPNAQALDSEAIDMLS
jgi:hypothetical protein